LVTSLDPDAAEARREENLAVLKEIFASISSGNFDGMLDHTAEDLTFELPYGPEGFPPSFDRASFDSMQKYTFKLFSKFSIGLVDHHPCLDPDMVIAEYASEAEVAKSGKPYKNRYIGVFRFRDGKVVGWKEFHNPEAATKALSPE
jgi:ketosteroid isomerase-like protein